MFFVRDKDDNNPPEYSPKAMQSYRRLQYRSCVYGDIPEKGEGVRLGIYQAQAACGDGATEKNLARLEEVVDHASRQGVQLLSFPELYLPGYTLDPETADKISEQKDGPSITRCREIAKQYKMALLVPYGEKAVVDGNEMNFDSIAVISETGELITSYRKTHLYAEQERQNWAFGDELCPVFEVNGFPVSVLNCYECEFPELVRALSLRGAKLIVGPTAADGYYNLAQTGERSKVPYPDVSRILFPANAYHNHIFFAYSNRCGVEERDGNQWHYRGNSIICGPQGDIIVAAEHEQDTLLIADCIPSYYGDTHPEPEFCYLKDRRPELYKELTEQTVHFDKDPWTYPKHIDGKEVPKR